MSEAVARHLFTDIKENGDDYEFYPTTNEIIEAFYNDIYKIQKGKRDTKYPSISLLDIGAGNGKIFTVFKNLAKKTEDESEKMKVRHAYAIEKSQTLINAMDDDIFIIGTDFWGSTLVDKKVDVIFSNPPYSSFAAWSEKIIKEANADEIYLVVPERWEDNPAIQNAMSLRKAEYEIVGNFSFENSEDRKARAKVDLIRITLRIDYKYRDELKVDPFDLWFSEMYPFNEEVKDDDKNDLNEAAKKREKIKELVKGGNLIERLEELYNKDLMHLHENYKGVAALDANLLQELGVSKKAVREALKLKIKGTKDLYWQELFNNLDTITSRLTQKSREKMLSTLSSNTAVDFSAQNAYAVVIFAIKNANKYYDEQLLELYTTLSKIENINLYKSNKRVLKDDWRYLKEEMSHYALDYRIVMHFWTTLEATYSYQHTNGLGNDAANLIKDILTIATNLNFNIESRVEDSSMKWVSQHKNNFFFKDLQSKKGLKKGTKTHIGKIEDVVYQEDTKEYQYLIDGYWRHWSHVKIDEDIFVEIKAFKNGNLHFKFNKKFMKALNIEAARLCKWIKSPQNASEEFDISIDEAIELFGSNFTLLPETLKNLLPGVE